MSRRSLLFTILIAGSIGLCLQLCMLPQQKPGCKWIPTSPKSTKLTIVISISDDRTEDYFAVSSNRVLTNRWRAYAKLHNYNFHLALVSRDPDRHFCSSRWRNLVRLPAWSSSDWILHLDLDTAVLNMSRPLDEYIPMQKDIVFALRENNEAAASTVLLRTTAFTKCFLEQLSDMGVRYMSNLDNGDLLQVIMEHISVPQANVCSLFRAKHVIPEYANNGTLHLEIARANYTSFTRCFVEILDKHKEYIADVSPFAFLQPMSGYWRSLFGLRNFSDPKQDFRQSMYYACWHHDFIVHGWKQLGSIFEGTQCTILHPDAELKVARMCCAAAYPRCMNGSVNICSMQTHCRGLGYGQILQSCHWDENP